MKKSLERLLVIAAAITLILPIDLIPDTLPVIGWLDDLAAIIFLIKELVGFFQKRKLVISSNASVRK